MKDISEKLIEASSDSAIRFIARAIHQLTVEARDPDAGVQKLRKINEMIHGLAGTIMATGRESMPAKKAARISEILSPLGHQWVDGIEALSPLVI